jgi:hypothetical protein
MMFIICSSIRMYILKIYWEFYHSIIYIANEGYHVRIKCKKWSTDDGHKVMAKLHPDFESSELKWYIKVNLRWKVKWSCIRCQWSKVYTTYNSNLKSSAVL